jgi:pSer/pThr/pTyr-binding forkhead associated (FHA) protein
VPTSLIHFLTYVFLAFLWLFFIRVLFAVITEIRQQRLAIQEAIEEINMSAGSQLSPLKLRILEPPEYSDLSFELTDDVTIGRAQGCSIALQYDNFLSLIHARIFVKDNKLWIEDLGSTNGTFLNDKPLKGPAQIKRGDVVQLGSTTLEVYR